MPPEPVRLFSVAEYHEMKRIGLLDEDEPVELLEGWLVSKMSRNPPHDLALLRIQGILFRALPAEWLCFSQSAITTDKSEPEPDVAIVKGPDHLYATRHPAPSDIAIAIEVADSSLNRDRTLKKRIYARSSVPEYWILNIPDRQLEIFTDPTGNTVSEPTFNQEMILKESENVMLRLQSTVITAIPVRDLLP